MHTEFREKLRCGLLRHRRYRFTRECGRLWRRPSRVYLRTISKKASREYARANTRFWSSPPRMTSSTSVSRATRWKSAAILTLKATALAHRLAQTWGILYSTVITEFEIVWNDDNNLFLYDRCNKMQHCRTIRQRPVLFLSPVFTARVHGPCSQPVFTAPSHG